MLQKFREKDQEIVQDMRNMSNIYSFFINGKRKIICKTMYLNTLSISEQFVKTAQLKGGRSGLVLDDQRGKHIPSNKCDLSIITDIKNHIDKYPAYSSHFSTEEVYRFLFDYIYYILTVR